VVDHRPVKRPYHQPLSRLLDDFALVLQSMGRSLQLTTKAPVTMTIMPPFSLEGCASVVSTRCCTFLNDKVCEGTEMSAFLNKQLFLYP
jgi:hypothetical protein